MSAKILLTPSLWEHLVALEQEPVVPALTYHTGNGVKVSGAPYQVVHN